MDPSNPLRGPRRAARRGEEALRYDRPNDAAATATTAEAVGGELPRPAPAQARPSIPQLDYFDPGPMLRLNDDDTYTLLERTAGGRWGRTPDPNAPLFTLDGEDDPYHLANENNGGHDSDDNMFYPLRNRRIVHSDFEGMPHGMLLPWEQDLGGGQLGADGEVPDMEEEDEEENAGDPEDAERGEEQEGEEGEDDGEDGLDDVQEDGEDDNDDDDGEDDGDDGAGDDGGGDDDDFEFASQQGDELHGPDDDALISFDPMLIGLKEINNLAHFSVSSHKPGNGIEELLHDDLNKYWQSDGPQPHLLTIHFLRRVEIRAIRFYVDYNQDESYTPTSVILSAGTGHHDLLEFASLALTTPVGWQEIDLSHVGGGADGQSLCCWIVQIKVKENHQNGKDTHIRGIKLYAIDENAPPADSALDELARIKTRTLQMQSKFKDGLDPMIEREDYLFERLITQPPDKLPGAPERSGSMATFLRDQEIR